MTTRKKVRDMSRAQYVEAMHRYGFTRPPVSFMGYWLLPGSDSAMVSDWNAPEDTNRSRLAYMIRQAERAQERAS